MAGGSPANAAVTNSTPRGGREGLILTSRRAAHAAKRRGSIGGGGRSSGRLGRPYVIRCRSGASWIWNTSSGSCGDPSAFSGRTPAELGTLAREYALALPPPQRVFLAREESTPILGFPVLQGDTEHALRAALERYIEAEEELQWAAVSRRATDPKAYQAAWEEYRSQLGQVTENVTSSSFGRRYPSIFWLYHSIALSRLLKEIPRRLVRRDAELARLHGDEVKYKVLRRYLDKVFQLTYDAVQTVARQTEDREDELFPQLLQLMRDNVLILTEDHIGPDLSQLASYFRGYLRQDPERHSPRPRGRRRLARGAGRGGSGLCRRGAPGDRRGAARAAASRCFAAPGCCASCPPGRAFQAAR